MCAAFSSSSSNGRNKEATGSVPKEYWNNKTIGDVQLSQYLSSKMFVPKLDATLELFSSELKTTKMLRHAEVLRDAECARLNIKCSVLLESVKAIGLGSSNNQRCLPNNEGVFTMLRGNQRGMNIFMPAHLLCSRLLHTRS